MITNKLTIYDLTQPTEMHKDYNLWHILRNGDGLADVQNQREALKIVKELQRQANEVHALRAEVEWLRKSNAQAKLEAARLLRVVKNIETADERDLEREEELRQKCDRLTRECYRLREERRWRTFPANLPDANGRYVCMWADGDVYIQRWEGSKWLGAFDHEITHWQPLPAPPAKEE